MKKLLITGALFIGSLCVVGVNPAWSADFSRDHDTFRKTDAKYASHTSECPSSASLRKALESITQFPPEEIVIDEKTWIVKNWSIYTKGLTAQEVSQLPLVYDSFSKNKAGKTMCLVQFHKKPGGANDASMAIIEK